MIPLRDSRWSLDFSTYIYFYIVETNALLKSSANIFNFCSDSEVLSSSSADFIMKSAEYLEPSTSS